MRIVAIWTLFVLSSIVWAKRDDISVEITVDTTNVSQLEDLNLSVHVKGLRRSPEPRLLNLKGFRIVGTGTQSSVQYVNGRMSVQTRYDYRLAPPEAAGKYRIGPAFIVVDDETYESDTVDITVSKQKSHAGVDGAKDNQQKKYYITAQIDNPNPYVGEQIVFTFRLYVREQVSDPQLQLPEFDGFWKENLGNQNTFQKVINGIAWSITEIKTALFPISAGVVRIAPTRLVANVYEESRRRRRRSLFDDFFYGGQTRRVQMVSDPIEVRVRSLPSVGVPNGFSGLVGKFQMKADLSQSALATGESTTLTVEVSGQGNLQNAQMKYPASETFKVYEDSPEFKSQRQGTKIFGKKTFKWALVPLKAGTIALDPPQLIYFDPEAQAYRTLSAEVAPLEVAPGGNEDVSHVGPSSSPNRKKKIEVLGEDLMPIKRDVAALDSATLSNPQRVGFIAAFIAMPFMFLLGIFTKSRRDRIRGDKGYAKRSRAYRSFCQGLKKLGNEGRFFESSAILLKSYLGDKMDIDGRALTPSDAKRRLGERLSEPTIDSIRQFLEKCELGQYGGSKLDKSKEREIAKNLQSVVQQVEKEIRA